jgi:hypothetical protein
MSLKKLRQRLTIDQTNILTGTVVQDKTDTVQVRTSKGEIREAVKPAGTTYQPGARLTLHTDGRTVTVTGPAPLAALGGEVIYTV